MSALHVLQYAPLFTLSFGYWTLGNRQMFFNNITPKTTAFGELIDPKHPLFITNYEQGGQHLIPILMAIVIIIFQGTFIKYISKLMLCGGCLQKKGEDSEGIDIYDDKLGEKETVNEQLGRYRHCIGGMEQKRWYA